MTRERKQIWVGMRSVGEREVFKSSITPTQETHGSDYIGCIGPFRTMRGARVMVNYGGNNPNIQCVADAERIGRKETNKRGTR